MQALQVAQHVLLVKLLAQVHLVAMLVALLDAQHTRLAVLVALVAPVIM